IQELGAGTEGEHHTPLSRYIYSPPRRGGVDAPSIKWIRSEIGAAGVVSSAKLFRPQHLIELIMRLRASASRRARQLLLREVRRIHYTTVRECTSAQTILVKRISFPFPTMRRHSLEPIDPRSKGNGSQPERVGQIAEGDRSNLKDFHQQPAE